MDAIPEKKNIKLTVFRYNPETDKKPRYETYEAEWVPSLNPIMALTYINAHSRSNIAFRRGCREAGCGACTITVNGVPRLACRTVAQDGDVLEPLKGYPVIRDLVVDRSEQTADMFRKIKYGREGKPIGFVPASPEDMDISRKLTICTDCHGCNSICPPWLENRDMFVGPMYMLNIIRSMFNPLEEYNRIPQAVQMGLYNCTLCGACTFECPRRIDLAEAIIAARGRAVKEDVVPDEVRRIHRNIVETESLSGIDKENAASWAAQLDLPKSGKTLFFSSCEYSATEDGRRILALTAQLLKKAGISLSYLYDEEPCCGGPLYFYGFRDDFNEKVGKVVKLFKERGVEEIITPSPSCAYTLKELYPRYAGDFNIKVSTALEVISGKIKSKDINLKDVGKQKVVFHDPAFLSRYLKLSETPREILVSIPGLSVENPKFYWGVNTMADGNFGVSEELNSKIAQNRLKELAASGAPVVITASAFDLSKMKKAAQDLAKKDIEIIDLIEFVSQALEV